MKEEASASILALLNQSLNLTPQASADELLVAISTTKMSSLLEIPAAEMILEQALVETEDPAYEPVRLEILAALVRFGQRRHLAELRMRMEAETGVVRLDFAKSLVELGDERARSALRDAVYLKESEPRWYAVQALAKLQDDLARQYLLGGLSQADPSIKFDCAWVMAKAGWDEGYSILDDNRTAVDFDRRFYAAEALAYLGDAPAHGFFINLIETGSDEERLAAIMRAGTIPIPSAKDVIEGLLPRLTGIDLVAGLFALGNIGAPDSLGVVRPFAHSTVPLTRLAGNTAVIQIIEQRKVPMDTF
jgi:HEAT repeat protein